jgi:hypothetical protein
MFPVKPVHHDQLALDDNTMMTRLTIPGYFVNKSRNTHYKHDHI